MRPIRDDAKVNRVREIIRREGIEALVSHVPENVTYLSGAWCGQGLSYVVFPLEGDPILILPTGEMLPETWVSKIGRYATETHQHLGRPLDSAAEKIHEALVDLGIVSGRIGVEQSWHLFLATTMRYEMHIIDARALIRKLPAYSAKDSSALLIEARSIKTAEEIRALRNASRIAQIGLDTFSRNLRANLTEIELSAKIEHEIITQGVVKYRASRVLACASVASGPLTVEGYKDLVGNTRRRLRPHDLVMLELNVTVDGYSSDTTRTLVVGKPNKKQRALFDAVLDSQTTAISAIRPGVRAAEIARLSNDIIRRHGFYDYLVHRLGHGVGVSPHDAVPTLHVESKDTLEPGMVHSVEPGIYGAKIGGVRIEDVILDTRTGAEYLSEFPRAPE
jgi:Xaa-Pro dipeptidase